MDKQKLKRYWDEKPLEVLAVGAAVVTATAKLIDAVSSAQSKRAYAKQINRKK